MSTDTGHRPLVMLPEPGASEWLDDIVDEIDLVFWDGRSEPPPNAAEVEFMVPPGGFGVRGPLAELLPKMASLKVLQTRLAGIDHYEPFALPSVAICNTRGMHNRSVPEYVIGMIIATYRAFPFYFEAQREGGQQRRQTETIDKKTVLILGYGEIGQAIERILNGFDVEVIRVASRPREGDVYGPESLLELAPRADVLVMVLPMNESSAGIVNRQVLKAMPDGGILVNVSRGGLLDQETLVEEVRSGRLRAVLDAVDPEPLPIDHPLRTTPGIIYTPHVAASIRREDTPAEDLVNRQIRHYVYGEPLENIARPAS